jgi:hypothetical protein
MKFSTKIDYKLYFSIIIIFYILSPLLSCMRTSRCCLGLPEFTHDGGDHQEIMIEMRDGVKLCTNIYFPKGKGPWPVVLIRSPYNMNGGINYLAETFARYGYVGIHQDVRGRFDSGGEWYFFLHERDDGSDTLSWLVKQSWQDGNIALFGQSYFAYTEMVVADILPPEVKTIIPMTIATDLKSMASESGMCRADLCFGLGAMMYDKKFHPFNGGNFEKALKHYPQGEVDVKYFGGHIEWFQELISFPESKSWHGDMARISLEIPEKINVPVLMISGWYDLFTVPQLADFQRLKSRDKSRIMIGPWAHLLGIKGDGDKKFPGAGYLLDYLPRILNWLDHYLRGGKLADWGPVEIYAIGDSRWETYKAWPPQTKAVRFYPVDSASSNSCDGGKLKGMPANTDEQISYVYDPLNPVPTTGGNSLLMFSIPGFGGADPSSRDQKGLCERDDVITFVSDPMNEPLQIRGTVKVGITVSSDAPDTSFTAKLIEVDPEGRALNITDGITRLAFRNGSVKPLTYTPGEKVKLDIKLPPTAWTLKPGYRLRLDLSSSNFPAYNAHPNKAGYWAEQKDPVKAKQTIYTGREDAAFVELPVLEGNAK